MRALEGPLAINTHLKQAQYLFPGDLRGPEAFVRDERGKELGEREWNSLGHVWFLLPWSCRVYLHRAGGWEGGEAGL